MNKRNGVLIGLVFVFGVVGVVGCDITSDPNYIPFSEMPKESDEDRKDRTGKLYAQNVSETFVKQILYSPSTASFPRLSQRYPQEGVTVNKIGPDKWQVNSWVETHNVFGAPVRVKYYMEVEIIGDLWHQGAFVFDGKFISEGVDTTPAEGANVGPVDHEFFDALLEEMAAAEAKTENINDAPGVEPLKAVLTQGVDSVRDETGGQ